MIIKLIIVGSIFYGFWLFLGYDLDNYDGCKIALYSKFTGIEDEVDRMNMARFRCDELVAKGKVKPEIRK